MTKKSLSTYRYPLLVGLLLCTASFYGCGHSDDNSTPEGVVTQGPVEKARVFADHLTPNNKIMDAGEETTNSTLTDADGHFKFPKKPSYPYMVVSFGGTDTITGQPAMQMLASSEDKNLSPLTTLVTLAAPADRAATIAAIEALGVKYDDDISKKVTPAALLFVQSVQTAVATVTAALDPSNNKLTTDQTSDIQRTLLTQISTGIKNQTPTQLTTPATLTTTLQTAVKTGLDTIIAAPANSNITLQAGQTTTLLANASVSTALIDSVANAISTTGTFSTSPSSAVKEEDLVSAAEVTTINTQSTTAVGNTTSIVTVVPKPNTAPTISGTPKTTAPPAATYSFVPTAADADGNTLTFSITNKPAWADFNTATGELTGKPQTKDAGTTTAIKIEVTDGIATTSLPLFNITVAALTGGQGGTP